MRPQFYQMEKGKKMNRVTVYGFGEMIIDHVFVKGEHGLKYMFSRGGGPVWNTLLNLSINGVPCSAVGSLGGDSLGDLALQDLSTHGCNVSLCQKKANKKTRPIYEELCLCSNRANYIGHKFNGATCLVCNNDISDSSIAKFDIPSFNLKSHSLKNDINILLFDRLTDSRTAIIANRNTVNSVSAIDIGRIGYLRFVPGYKIANSINMFNILFMPKHVENVLTSTVSFCLDLT